MIMVPGKIHRSFIVILFICGLLLSQTYEVKNPSSSQNLITSDHFVVRYNNSDGVTLTNAQIQNGLKQLEGYWKFYVDTVKFIPPYSTASKKFKVDVFVSNQGYATGSGVEDIHPTMWLSNDGFVSGDWALVHELAHCFQFTTRSFRDSKYVGWFWENHAEFMSAMFTRSIRDVAFQVNSPHILQGSTRFRYGEWLFLDYIKDQYGIAIINDMWNKAYKPENPDYLKEEPYLVLARNQGWTQTQLNDEFGKWAMHNVTWDYKERKTVLANAFKYSDVAETKRGRVTILDTLDLSKRRFAVPNYWAPQRWGYNLVRIYPDAGATNIKVTFQGVIQEKAAISKFDPGINLPTSIPQPNSGWRWGIVCVSSNGSPRYSALQSNSSGYLELPVLSNDLSVWLVVLAAPSINESHFWDQAYNSNYRYPWMVQFESAFPEGYQAGTNSLPDGISGKRHLNGGGWVASTALVSPTAYVGPKAQVQGKAQVQDNARIEGYAIIKGSAIVKDDAVVSGHAVVSDNALVYERAKITDNAGIYGTSKISGNAIVKHLSCVNGSSSISGNAVAGSVIYAAFNNRTLSGTAQALGDIILNMNISSGIYIGGDISTASNDAIAAARTSEPGEVTSHAPYVWNESSIIMEKRSFERKGPNNVIVNNTKLKLQGFPNGIIRVKSFNASGRIVWQRDVFSLHGIGIADIPQSRSWIHITTEVR